MSDLDLLDSMGGTTSEKRIWRRAAALIAVFLAGGFAYQRVFAVERKLDNHLGDVRGAARYMVQFATWNAKTLHQLCMANPQAKCEPPPVPAMTGDEE
jgi:hypothetical protein